MEPSFSIAIINHSFQMEYYARRWKLFADRYQNVQVWLVTFDRMEWYKNKGYSFGKSFILEGKNIDEGNYHVRTIRRHCGKLGYTSKDFCPLFRKINPDIIYLLGGHNDFPMAQILHLRKKYFPKTKVIGFSMRGPALNMKICRDKCGPVKWILRRLRYFVQWQVLKYNNRHVDAYFCHYPDAINCFRLEGYKGPIYMQTQVGVNKEWFHEDAQARALIRKKYQINDNTYVFGSATRFTIDKGVDDILRALPKEGDWKYLMMGSGSDDERERLHKIIIETGLQDKVIETGFIDWFEIAKYWNAIDCAIHVPHTTPEWEETFSLAAIQPQITRKPVIGDTSGSVPYQIGYPEMIVPECDVMSLSKKIEWVLSHKSEAKQIGEKMYIRTLNSFEVQHLNDLFYRTLVEDVLPGKFDPQKVDMTKYDQNH